ncbi:MAG TPA: selenium metabolism-associated LysR family transcriptional regulator [Candidatus Polarisedimenticolia bacterium]
MEIAQLRTFLAVLEHAGFSRAARALATTQSTVSFHIKSLEKDVGARLLDRDAGRVRPTQAGRALARYASRILALRSEALERIHSLEGLAAGQLDLAASTIPGEYLLPAILAGFRGSHPSVQIKVRVSDSAGALGALLADECELAFLGTRQADRRVIYTPFADDEIILIGPVPNPFAPVGSLTTSRLREVPLVLRESGSGTRRSMASLLSRHGLRGAAELGSTEAVKRGVLSGMGLGFVSRLSVRDELKAGALAVVKAPGLPVRRSIYAARLRGRSLSAAARAFLDLVNRGSRFVSHER